MAGSGSDSREGRAGHFSEYRSEHHLVFFDWDNTLVDSWGLVHESMQATLRSLGEAEWSAEETKVRLGASLRDNFPRLFGERSEQARILYRAYFLSHHLKRIRAFAGAQSLLADLFSGNSSNNFDIEMAIISNKIGSALRAEVSHLGWQKYFGAVLGAEDCTSDKPDPACMTEALSRLGLASSASASVIYIGDSLVDMEFAHRSNALGVLLSAEAMDSRFAEYPAHHQVSDFTSLRALLTSLLGFKL